MDWYKITQALFLAAMLLILYPRVKQAFKNPSESSDGKWGLVLIPLLIVGIIVAVLISSVR